MIKVILSLKSKRILPSVLFKFCLIFIILHQFLSSQTMYAAEKYVVDEAGRKVYIKTFPPKRIISLAPNITELVFALGKGNKLVGVTKYCNKPKEALKIAKVGGFSDPNIEIIVSLKPDLVLATMDGNPQYLINNLNKFSIPIYAIKTKKLFDILNNVKSVGEALGSKVEAEKLYIKLLEFISNRKTLIRNNRKRIFFLLWDNPITTIGKDSYVNEIIELSGGSSVTSIYSGDWFQMNPEEVLNLKFDILLYSRHSYIEENKLLNNKFFQKIISLNKAKVYGIDEEILRPGINFPLVIEELSKRINGD